MKTKNYLTIDKTIEQKCLNGRLAARYLGVSYGTFVSIPDIPYFKIGNSGTKRYSKDELDKWIQKKTVNNCQQ